MYIGRRTTVYHESFEAEKFRGKLYMQTFAKKTFEESHILPFKTIFEQGHPKISYKKFREHAKTVKTAKLFCLKTFMVYGIIIKIIMSIYVLAT